MITNINMTPVPHLELFVQEYYVFNQFINEQLRR